MADAPLPAPLPRAREQKINELSVHFANDDLSLEELERRIERVYKAATIAELEEITADLRLAAVPPPQADAGHVRRAGAKTSAALAAVGTQVESGRIRAIMSSTRRIGRWAVPRQLDVLALMSDTKIDLTNAALPPGVIEIELRAIMTSFKLIVPPGMRVIMETHSFMSSVRSRADELPPDDASAGSAPVVRIRGTALMADVNVVVRRKEDAAYYDDDDDD